MIDGPQTVQRIIAMLPPDAVKTTFVLKSQQPRQAGYTSIPWGYAREYSQRSIQFNEVLLAGALIGEEWTLFELFLTTETVIPKTGDMLTDDSGADHQIKTVVSRMMGYIFHCLCLKNK